MIIVSETKHSRFVVVPFCIERPWASPCSPLSLGSTPGAQHRSRELPTHCTGSASRRVFLVDPDDIHASFPPATLRRSTCP
jgi:hypothetical protein